MSMRQIVYDQISAVAQQQGKVLAPLRDTQNILESGLDSLCVAIIIASLDDKLNASPFDNDSTEIPVTIGDLVQIYQNAVQDA